MTFVTQGAQGGTAPALIIDHEFLGVGQYYASPDGRKVWIGYWRQGDADLRNGGRSIKLRYDATVKVTKHFVRMPDSADMPTISTTIESGSFKKGTEVAFSALGGVFPSSTDKPVQLTSLVKTVIEQTSPLTKVLAPKPGRIGDDADDGSFLGFGIIKRRA